MTEKVVSTYRGFGHKVHLVRRDAVSRSWAVMDNRRVVLSSSDELTAKRSFMNHTATIIYQTTLDL